MKKTAKDVKISDVIKIHIGGALFPCQKKVTGVKKENDDVSIMVDMSYGSEVFHYAPDDLIEIA